MRTIIKFISFLILAISGIFLIVYEYLIWDKSNIPGWLFNSFTIMGIVAAVIFLITVFTKKRNS